MNTSVSFLIIESDETSKISAQNAVFLAACHQASWFYRQQQKVFIYTENQQDAEIIDELLWSFEPDSFVAHNLLGEGPKYGAPVEISWQAPNNRKAILINLTSTVPQFAQQYSHIVDFVPSDDSLKQLARERFKVYRQWQYSIETTPWLVPSSATN